MAASHGVHDHSCDFFDMFSGRLHNVSRAGRRKIFRIHRLDRGGLLPDAGFTRPARVCDVAARGHHARSGFSPVMGSAQTYRALDNPYLALRLGHGRARIFNAL